MPNDFVVLDVLQLLFLVILPALRSLCNIQINIGDYEDKNELHQKVMDIHRTLKNLTEYGQNYRVYGNGTTGDTRRDLTSAMMTMRGMFQADHRFAGQSQKRFVTVIVSAGVALDMDRLETITKLLYSDGIDFISVGKGISR